MPASNPDNRPDTENTALTHNSQRKMGLTMLAIAWLAILAILISLFDDWLDSKANPNQTPQNQMIDGYNQVTLQANHQHHYVVNGLINQKPVVLLLDTGATDVVIPSGLANNIGLKRGPKQWAHTANGTISVYRTEIDSLTIANIELTNIVASINPSMDGDVVLLGMSALKQIEFFQRGDKLTLKQ